MQERALLPFSFHRRYWACACPGDNGAPTKPSHIYTIPGTTNQAPPLTSRAFPAAFGRVFSVARKEGAAYEAKSLH